MSDEALIQRCNHADERAFETLYARFTQPMLGYFYRMLGRDGEKAQDFLQDLFVKVIEHGQTFREGARFKTWLYAMAYNMCKNEYRRIEVRRGIDPHLSPDHLADHSANGVVNGDLDWRALNRRIDQELMHLDPGQRTAFVLRFQQQLSIREISDIMSCAEGTTKSRLYYATKKLAGKLKAFHPQSDEVNGNEHS